MKNGKPFQTSSTRYSVSRQAMHKSGTHGGILKKNTSAFQYMGCTLTCTITPAPITDLDGEERDYYPSATGNRSMQRKV